MILEGEVNIMKTKKDISRRKFLAGVAATAAVTTTIASPIISKPAMTENKVFAEGDKVFVRLSSGEDKQIYPLVARYT